MMVYPYNGLTVNIIFVSITYNGDDSKSLELSRIMQDITENYQTLLNSFLLTATCIQKYVTKK